MTKHWIAWTSLALGLALAAPSAAADRKYGEVDTATVAAVDTQALRVTVDTRDGARVFQVEPATRILRGSDAIELDALSVGDRVVIEANDEVGDDSPRLVADRILIVVD